MTSTKKVLCGSTLILIVLVAWFVWPTPYRYDRMNFGGTEFPVRTHRITGRTEILFPSGWTVTSTEESEKQTVDISNEEMALMLIGTMVHSEEPGCRVDAGGSITFTVFNSLDVTLETVTARVRFWDKGMPVKSEEFILHLAPGFTGGPYRLSQFTGSTDRLLRFRRLGQPLEQATYTPKDCIGIRSKGRRVPGRPSGEN
ncbi:MAG TPA: hypothetical protein VIC04_10305 [Terriglobia bacterium]|jgi:hypothetical protein